MPAILAVAGQIARSGRRRVDCDRRCRDVVRPGANIGTLTAGQIARLGPQGVDRIDSTDSALADVAQYQALGTVALTSADLVTVSLTSAEFNALVAADFTTFGTNLVDVLDVDGGTNSAVSISAAKAAALVGTSGLSIAAGDVVTLADTGANIAGLYRRRLGALAAHGIDTIDATVTCCR